MRNLTIIDAAETTRTIAADPALSLMEVLRATETEGIIAECGGTAACATCQVILDEKLLAGVLHASEHELGMLGFAAVTPRRGSLLSCQVQVFELPDGAEITLPESQL